MITLIHDPACATYQKTGHPEAPFRVRESAAHLLKAHPDWNWMQPQAAGDRSILRAHSPQFLMDIEHPLDDFDGDTPAYPQVSEIARATVGAGLDTMHAALKGQKTFSLMRPPGHHATRTQAMGFCYLNSIAIAALEAVELGVERVAIYDFDAHHGNGTEDIVLNHPKIRFCSVHQYPGYPGTGTISRANCFNWPVLPMTPRAEYLHQLRLAWEKVLEFNPGLILISAGFDAYSGDPITEMTLELEDFAKLGMWAKNASCPTAALMEGGYSRDLPLLIDAFLTEWN